VAGVRILSSLLTGLVIAECTYGRMSFVSNDRLARQPVQTAAEDERGPGTFTPTLEGLVWLARSGFKVAVAGRTMWGDDPTAQRDGYAQLFSEHGISIDTNDPAALVLFPEMGPKADVPEITTDCWGKLGKSPADVMCASSRMVVKRKGSAHAVVVSCTLIPYDKQFELDDTLGDAKRSVSLNHPHCAKFCVLGGASCSANKGSESEPVPLHPTLRTGFEAVS
jgi:hypothetical protein